MKYLFAIISSIKIVVVVARMNLARITQAKTDANKDMKKPLIIQYKQELTQPFFATIKLRQTSNKRKINMKNKIYDFSKAKTLSLVKQGYGNNVI
jgi:hypothetical protein